MPRHTQTHTPSSLQSGGGHQYISDRQSLSCSHAKNQFISVIVRIHVSFAPLPPSQRREGAPSSMKTHARTRGGRGGLAARVTLVRARPRSRLAAQAVSEGTWGWRCSRATGMGTGRDTTRRRERRTYRALLAGVAMGAVDDPVLAVAGGVVVAAVAAGLDGGGRQRRQRLVVQRGGGGGGLER